MSKSLQTLNHDDVRHHDSSKLVKIVERMLTTRESSCGFGHLQNFYYNSYQPAKVSEVLKSPAQNTRAN